MDDGDRELPFQLTQMVETAWRILSSPKYLDDHALTRRTFIPLLSGAAKAYGAGLACEAFAPLVATFDIDEGALVEACEIAEGKPKSNGHDSDYQVDWTKYDPPKGAQPEPEKPLPETVAWWRDPESIPRRSFLFGRHYARRTVGATIGAGGRGKTTLGPCEAISMAIGRNLMTDEPLERPLHVWCLNAEEDQDELDRRFAATCEYYRVTKADLGGRLFAQSVRNTPFRVANLVKGVAVINQRITDHITTTIKANAIDVFTLDPFVSFHGLNENDNGHMDLVIKEALGGIADVTNSACEIFHHPGKPKPGLETSVEDGRGASAILWAVRSARVLNFMTPDEAAKLGIAEDTRRRHIRILNGKANMGPIGTANWMRLELQNLPKGDEIVVASHWTPPDPFQNVTTYHMQLARRLATTGEYRADSRSPQWFGYAIAPMLDIPAKHGVKNDPKDLARLHSIINKWLENKVIETEIRRVEGKDRVFIVLGNFHPEPEPFVNAFPDDEYAIQ